MEYYSSNYKMFFKGFVKYNIDKMFLSAFLFLCSTIIEFVT